MAVDSYAIITTQRREYPESGAESSTAQKGFDTTMAVKTRWRRRYLKADPLLGAERSCNSHGIYVEKETGPILSATIPDRGFRRSAHMPRAGPHARPSVAAPAPPRLACSASAQARCLFCPFFCCLRGPRGAA